MCLRMATTSYLTDFGHMWCGSAWLLPKEVGFCGNVPVARVHSVSEDGLDICGEGEYGFPASQVVAPLCPLGLCSGNV